MLADGLTKDTGGSADLLRSVLRSGFYQISPENTVLDRKAQEKEHRQQRAKANAKNDPKSTEPVFDQSLKSEHEGNHQNADIVTSQSIRSL